MARSADTGGKAATIRDVAAAARVSLATVSNVLEGKGRFSAATAERVQAAALRLRYRRNDLARSLVRRRTRTLAFAAHREYGLFTANAYFTGVLSGMLERAVAAGWQLKIVAVAAGAEGVAQLEDGTVDGVALVAPAAGSPLLRWAYGSRIPCVGVSVAPGDATFPCVAVDDRAAAREATAALIALGHRRLAIIADLVEQPSGRERLAGWRDAQLAAGIEPAPAWQVHARYATEDGRQAALGLFAQPRRPTAVFCASDHIAVGALAAARASGVRVPDDVSLVGFDDLELCSHTDPPLSSVRQPLHEIGALAAGILIDACEGDAPRSRRRRLPPTLLPVELVRRASLAAPR